jgi:hypothetical protein
MNPFICGMTVTLVLKGIVDPPQLDAKEKQSPASRIVANTHVR